MLFLLMKNASQRKRSGAPGAWEWVQKMREANCGIKMRMLEPKETFNHDDSTDVAFEGVNLIRINEVPVVHVALRRVTFLGMLKEKKEDGDVGNSARSQPVKSADVVRSC
jgi:hypothetical protein